MKKFSLTYVSNPTCTSMLVRHAIGENLLESHSLVRFFWILPLHMKFPSSERRRRKFVAWLFSLFRSVADSPKKGTVDYNLRKTRFAHARFLFLTRFLDWKIQRIFLVSGEKVAEFRTWTVFLFDAYQFLVDFLLRPSQENKQLGFQGALSTQFLGGHNAPGSPNFFLFLYGSIFSSSTVLGIPPAVDADKLRCIVVSFLTSYLRHCIKRPYHSIVV